MPYCFMPLRRCTDGPGWEPAFPEGMGFLLLADYRESSWGVYDYDLTDAPSDDWTPDSPASAQLAALLDSAKRYPPAMALARDHVNRTFSHSRRAFRSGEPTQNEFSAELMHALIIEAQVHAFKQEVAQIDGKNLITEPLDELRARRSRFRDNACP